ncbi:histidine kinase [Oscillospiraceae bacterium HV4-5-C5C]|nr:histidine kinase [Oscillospiraceae bacterium HV4-5-C5C]
MKWFSRLKAWHRARPVRAGRIFTLQQKLTLTFSLSTALIFAVNLFLFVNINLALSSMDQVYLSNVRISQLSDSLLEVQTDLTDYLSTKSTVSLENYYRSESHYSNLINQLDISSPDTEVQIMLSNISNLSTAYIETAEVTLSAKRGRNIQKYKASYDEASDLYGYLDTYIYSLNSVQFRNNTSNYSYLRQSFRSLELITLFVLVTVSATNLAITLLLIRSLTDPLTALAQQARRISAGDFDVPALQLRRRDEISMVAVAFNDMSVSIRGYIAELRRSMAHQSEMKEKALRTDAALKEAELKYLQAQINPHFLFNTLNAGAQLAMMENASRSYQYLQNVAAFFRSKTNREKQVTTLADEIALADNYMYIINVRFGGEIRYDKSIDQELTSLTVPSLILQPIMENAVNHGVREIERERHITLAVYRSGRCTTVSVRDNGRGMTREQTAALLQGARPQRMRGDETNGVGLHNVISRLQLFYDQEDVFDITSGGIDQGTEVLLYLPRSGEES